MLVLLVVGSQVAVEALAAVGLVVLVEASGAVAASLVVAVLEVDTALVAGLAVVLVALELLQHLTALQQPLLLIPSQTLHPLVVREARRSTCAM